MIKYQWIFQILIVGEYEPILIS